MMVNDNLRPDDGRGSLVSRPRDVADVVFLGGRRFGAVALSRPQIRALAQAYGYREEPSGSGAIHKAGDGQNLGRDIEVDGVRVMGLLAAHLKPGQDPVRVVEELMIQAGWDVSDGHWEDKE